MSLSIELEQLRIHHHYRWMSGDFEFDESKHAFLQERLLVTKDVYSKDHIWYRNYLRDYIVLQLGNECNWCGRKSYEIPIEIDHILPKLRFFTGHITQSLAELQREFLTNPQDLRLLCKQCHKIRHAIGG